MKALLPARKLDLRFKLTNSRLKGIRCKSNPFFGNMKIMRHLAHRYIGKISLQLIVSVLFLLAVLITSIAYAQNINLVEATIGEAVSDSLLL